MLKAIRLRRFALGIAIVPIVVACGGPDPERHIIIDREPFYKVALPYREGSEDEIVSAVKTFAREHEMDFLGGPGHPALSSGQFNLTAAGKTLNLKAIRVATSLPDTEVYATVRASPTANDEALAAEFVRRLQKVEQSERERK